MATKKKESANQIKITLVKSTIGCLDKQKKTVQALGLKKIRSFVIRDNNPTTQGMVFVVKHLVKVDEVQG